MVFSTTSSRRKWFFCVFGALTGALLGAAGIDFANGVAYSDREPTEPAFFYDDGLWRSERTVALTFDDGPDPQKTLQILEILKKHEVPATFFFLGPSALRHPELVKRVYEEGYEIGNHTFTHSYQIHSSEARIAFELNLSNEIIKGITGEDTYIYRPPYLLDTGGDASQQVPPLRPQTPRWVSESGYVMLGADADSRDWAAKSPQEVVNNTLADVERGGRVVLLHDGTEGKYTPQALEPIILELKARGYTFASAGELLGLPYHPAGTPRVAQGAGVGALVVPVASNIGVFFSVVIGMGLGLLALRFIFVLLSLATLPKRKHMEPWRESFAVIVPVYNEAANLGATLESIFDSTQPVGEVIVVDDGSTDNSANIAREYMRRYPKRIRLFESENRGKASALMLGIASTQAKVVITMDGDTIFERHAIERLLRHFNEHEVSAVCGRVVVTPRPSLLNIFQHLEYTVGQQVEKRALERFNAISVIPGPIGAWRRKDLLAAGGYSAETLVEDQDMTLAMLRLGKKIRYEQSAVAYTEPPHTFLDFLRQRLRWTFGTLQCLWKYKSHLGDARVPGLGFFVLPNVAVFGFGMTLLYPFVDLFFLLSIPLGSWREMLGLYFVFIIIDMLYCAIGLVGEERGWKFLPLIPFQRLFYRFVMYWVVIDSLSRALEGSRLFWGSVSKFGATHLQRQLLETNGVGTYSRVTPERVGVSLQGPTGTSASSANLQNTT